MEKNADREIIALVKAGDLEKAEFLVHETYVDNFYEWDYSDRTQEKIRATLKLLFDYIVSEDISSSLPLKPLLEAIFNDMRLSPSEATNRERKSGLIKSELIAPKTDFHVLIDKGTASNDDIGRLLAKIDLLHRWKGGGGLRFSAGNNLVYAKNEVTL